MRLSLELNRADLDFAPGRFVMLSCRADAAYPEPLLRRPISVHHYDRRGRVLELLIRNVGRGTNFLAGLLVGTTLDIMGPLGNGYDQEGDFTEAILIGGGVGVAPLFSLAESLRNRGKKVTALWGFEHQYPLPFVSREADLNWLESGVYIADKYLVSIGINNYMASNTGSDSFVPGFVTDLLDRYLAATGASCDRRVFMCGPTPMLQAGAGVCRRHKVSAQVSLEERMGCGFGVCAGCAVTLKHGAFHKTAKVCVDGPVFDADTVCF